MKTLFLSHTNGGHGCETMGAEHCPAMDDILGVPHLMMLRIIEASPVLNLKTAFEVLGPGKMCTMYDMGIIKRTLTLAGIVADQRGHDNGSWGPLEFPYFWTKDALGKVPGSHPGWRIGYPLILARIEGVKMEGGEGDMGRAFSGPGSVVLSHKRYAYCENGGKWNLVKGFKEVNGLMVPILENRSDYGYWHPDPTRDEIHEYARAYPWFERSEPCAVALRPGCGNRDLSFVSYDGPTKIYRVVRRDWMVACDLLA